MLTLVRVPIALTVLCLVMSPVMAAEDLSGQNNTPRYFTLNGFDPGHPDKTVQIAQATPGKAPGNASGQPGLLPRAAPVQPTPLTNGEKWRYYLKSTYGLQSYANTAFSAGIKQANGSPEEWGGGIEGFAKRYGSSFGQKVINRSVRMSLQTLLHEEPRYVMSSRAGIWGRTLDAASQAIVVHKDGGGRRIAYSRFAGHFSGAYISRQWYPDRFHDTGDYLTSGFTSIGIDAAKNVFNEFWPDIKRMIHR